MALLFAIFIIIQYYKFKDDGWGELEDKYCKMLAGGFSSVVKLSKLQKALIYILIIVLFSVGLWGIREETRSDVWNSFPYFMAVTPSISTGIGLVCHIVYRANTFFKAFLLSWLGNTVTFIVLVILGLLHYNTPRDYSTFAFYWVISSVVLFLLIVFVQLFGIKSKLLKE